MITGSDNGAVFNEVQPSIPVSPKMHRMAFN